MPATYEPIATTTLSSTTTNITFSSIPNTYTDLRVSVVGIPTVGEFPRLRFNSSTSNYAYQRLTGNGTAVSSLSETGRNSIGFANDAATPSTTNPIFTVIDIFSYAGSTNKYALLSTSQDANGSGLVEARFGVWFDTTAITSVNLFFLTAASWAIGTTATLYGIKAA
jgi:hypothetical protein